MDSKWFHPNPPVNIYNPEHPKSYADEYLSYKLKLWYYFNKETPLSYNEWYKQEA